MAQAYNILKYGNAGELHIVPGNFYNDNSCNPDDFTICKKIRTHEGKWHDGSVCLSESEVRNVVATLGKKVCSECVKELYTDY